MFFESQCRIYYEKHTRVRRDESGENWIKSRGKTVHNERVQKVVQVTTQVHLEWNNLEKPIT